MLCIRGAKTAMTVALRSPELVTGLVPVDNAPIRARLSSDFARYIKGMQHIESANVTKQSDADKILQEYEEVRILSCYLFFFDSQLEVSKSINWISICQPAHP